MYLYGCSPLWFVWMPYYFALKFKIRRAKIMKKEIRFLADILDYNTDIYKFLVKKYRDIEEAENFNKTLIEEIKNDL